MNLSLHLQRLGLVGRQAAEVELHFLKMQRGILTHLLISLLPTVQLSKAKFLGAKRCPYISFSPSIRYSTTAMITFFELCGTGFGCCNDCSRCCCHNLRKAIYISMLLLNIYTYISMLLLARVPNVFATTFCWNDTVPVALSTTNSTANPCRGCSNNAVSVAFTTWKQHTSYVNALL